MCEAKVPGMQACYQDYINIQLKTNAITMSKAFKNVFNFLKKKADDHTSSTASYVFIYQINVSLTNNGTRVSAISCGICMLTKIDIVSCLKSCI